MTVCCSPGCGAASDGVSPPESGSGIRLLHLRIRRLRIRVGLDRSLQHRAQCRVSGAQQARWASPRDEGRRRCRCDADMSCSAGFKLRPLPFPIPGFAAAADGSAATGAKPLPARGPFPRTRPQEARTGESVGAARRSSAGAGSRSSASSTDCAVNGGFVSMPARSAGNAFHAYRFGSGVDALSASTLPALRRCHGKRIRTHPSRPSADGFGRSLR